MSVEVSGLPELLADLRRGAVELPKVFKDAKLAGDAILLAEVQAAWPKKTGQMAASFKPFANKNSAGVRSNHPGAVVQEFASTYKRRSRTGDGSVTVHMTKGGSPARYGYPALDRVQDRIVQVCHDALIGALAARGWLSED